ncbi:MAG: hypothetical protein R3277_10290 [Brumimicrobium sp.]|nr:hypothetical protein [Brumimicrobium sp.]
MNKSTSALFIVAATLSLTACKSEEGNEKKDAPLKQGVIEVDTTDVFHSDQYEFVLPRPFALAASFEEAGLKFDAGRMNSLENLENYKTEGKQLLNFGVYSTDLVYTIINDQPQLSIKYFEGIKKLADKIGMGKIFTEDELALKIEKNIADREMMEDLLIDVHEKSQEYLQNNQMRYLTAIQFAGAWIEGMYLASFDILGKDPKIIGHKVADHMTLLKNTIQGLEAYKDRDQDLQEVLDALKGLQETYNNLSSVQKAKGIPDLSMADIQIIEDEIRKIRTLIVA